MKKNLLWLLLLFVLVSGNVFGQTSNITIGNNVPMSTTNQVFSCNPNHTLAGAFYDGHLRRNSASIWWQDGYEFHYYNTSYVTVYNPFNSLRTSANNATVPPFQFRSQVLPVTRPSWQWVYLTIQDQFTYLQANNPRTQLAGQFVHYINRWRTQSFLWPNLPYAYRVDNGQFLNSPQINYNSSASNITPFSTPLNVCHDFYIARCGDGVVDNKNKPWWPNTDGKQWIQTANGFIPWLNTNFTDEVCDDWPNNGQPGYCNTTCSGYVPLPNPVCESISINPNPTFPNQATTITCNASNANSYSINITGPGSPFNYTLGNSFSYTPTLPGNYTVSCTVFGAEGTTPSTCQSQLLTVTDNSPQCESFTATPALVAVGEPVTLFCDGNQYSNTYQILVQNAASNLVASFNGWLPAPNNNVTNTWTPNAPGIYTSNCAVSNNNTQVSYCPGQTIVVGQADLWINKIANQTGVSQWGTISFTVSFGNSGTVAAQDITIEDILPAELTYVSHNIQGLQWGTPFNGQTIFGYSVWYSGLSLQPWQSASMTITATYTAATCNSNIINYATIYNTDIQSNTTAPFDCIPVAPANIVLDKKQHVTGNPTSANIAVSSGDVITYTITVSNNGASTQNNMYLKDVLPANTTYINSSISGIPGLVSNHANGVITTNTFSLAPGETIIWIITASIDVHVGSFLNTAYAKTTAWTILAQDSVLAICAWPEPAPALTLHKSIVNQQSYYMPGDTIVYNITFSNTGDGAAYDVVIQDILPQAVTYVSSSISPDVGTFLQSMQGWSQVISYGWFTLNPGQTVTVILTGIVNNNLSTNNTLNTAILQSSNHPTLTATANFVSKAIPYIKKYQKKNGVWTQQTMLVNIWDTIEYKIVVKNIGGATANNVIISDILPAGMSYISSSIDTTFSNTQVTSSGAQTIVSYHGISIAPGGQVIMYVQAQVDQSTITTYTNVWQVQFFNPQQTLTSSVTALRMPTASVLFQKSLTTTQSIYYPDDTVGFVLQLHNNGPATIHNIQLQDIWPNQNCIQFGSWTSNPSLTQTSTTNPYSWSYPSLAAWESIHLYLQGTVTNNPNCSGIHINTGIATYTVGNTQFSQTSIAQIQIEVPDPAQCLNLQTNTTSILLNPGQNNGSAQLTCTANQNASIRIDCGNGTSSPTIFGSTLSHSCVYNNTNAWQTFVAKCIVDNNTNPINACQKSISISQWSFNICGNGIVEWYEQCDLPNGTLIGNYLDNGFTPTPSHLQNMWYVCQNCALVGGTTTYEPPACFYTNTTISVQRGEILPFWRDLDKSVNTNITAGNTCTQPNSIPVGTMMCTFSFYAPNQLNPGSHISQFTTPCFGSSWGNDIYFDFFKTTFPDSQTALGRYQWIVPTQLQQFGEYKVVLDRVQYEYCNQNMQFIPNPQIVDRVCEVNFAVTRPYLVQKSAFSNVPQTTTIDIGDFYLMNGVSVMDATDIPDIMVLNASSYATHPNTTTMLHDFVSKYKQLAVTVNDPSINALFANASQISVSKVPGQQIYIFSSQGADRITLRELQWFNRPFTMIIDGMDLVVQWSMTNTNGMFLVKWGKISFQEPPNNICATRQTVHGVFITDQWFGIDDSQLLLNNSLGKRRCNQWWLTIRGALLWQHINALVAQRRSHLNTWFQIQNPNNPAALRAERRNKIFDGAALLIEYNPALRNNMPPWMSEFTQVLDIYRQ